MSAFKKDKFDWDGWRSDMRTSFDAMRKEMDATRRGDHIEAGQQWNRGFNARMSATFERDPFFKRDRD